MELVGFSAELEIPDVNSIGDFFNMSLNIELEDRYTALPESDSASIELASASTTLPSSI